MHPSQPLKIAVLSQLVKTELNETATITERVYDPVNMQFADIVARALGFEYELTFIEDGEMGRLLPDGNWTGVIGMVHREEVDLAISSVGLTENRCRVVSCSYPYECIRMTFGTRNPKYSSGILAFLRPFSYPVWLFLIMFLICMPFLFYAVFSRRYTIRSFFYNTYKVFLHQPINIKSRRMSESILLLSWIIGMMFLSYSYSAVLLSFMTFPPISRIRTIPELSKAVLEETHQCFTIPGTFIVEDLVKSSDMSAQIIGQDLLQHEGTRDVEALLENVETSKIPVFIAGTDLFEPLKLKYFVSEDTFFPLFLTIPMRKNFCCKRKLKKIIDRIWAGGLYKKVVDDHAFFTHMRIVLHSKVSISDATPLSIKHFRGEFLLFAAGLILSIIVFLLEIIFGRRKLKDLTAVYSSSKRYIQKSGHIKMF